MGELSSKFLKNENNCNIFFYQMYFPKLPEKYLEILQ